MGAFLAFDRNVELLYLGIETCRHSIKSGPTNFCKRQSNQYDAFR